MPAISVTAGAAVLDAARAGDVAALGALLAEHPEAAAPATRPATRRSSSPPSAATAPPPSCSPRMRRSTCSRRPSPATWRASPSCSTPIPTAPAPCTATAGRCCTSPASGGCPPPPSSSSIAAPTCTPCRATPTANTALHATLAISGDLATARLLLARGADANAVGGAGWRPLHLAASRGHAAAVELLLAHGADPAARADDGRDAAAIARERGFPAVADALGRLTDG
jgi:hypothetical protein